MALKTRANFLMVVAVIFFIYSVLWALAPFPSINLPARLILDLSDWPLDKFTSPLDRETQWLSAIASGILAAISVILGGIVVPAIKARNTEIIRTTIIAMFTVILSSSHCDVCMCVCFSGLHVVLVLFGRPTES